MERKENGMEGSGQVEGIQRGERKRGIESKSSRLKEKIAKRKDRWKFRGNVGEEVGKRRSDG